MACMILQKSSLHLSLIAIIVAALASFSHGLNLNQTQSQLLSSSPISSTKLNYHGGPLLTRLSTINVYIIWYGSFSLNDRTTINDFFASFNTFSGQGQPTVSKWWGTSQAYKDSAGKPIPTSVRIAKQIGDVYSLGKNIKRAQIAGAVVKKIETKELPLDSNGIYLVLTAKDVMVERFCMGSCGFHDSITLTSTRSKVVLGHVGDPSVQCPGACAWPYAVPAYGPPGPALVAPNGVGADGLVMNIATILAGSATNPFKNGYYQGDALAPLEAVTACPGIFGDGAYPGYPGKLVVDSISKASFNAFGVNGRKFLLPAMWDPTDLSCKVVA